MRMHRRPSTRPRAALASCLFALAATGCAAPGEDDVLGETRAAIVGGTASALPSVVAVAIRPSACGQPFQVVCSGSVVAERAVLTAAHCFEDRRPGLELVVLAGADVSAPELSIHTVLEVLAHPDFDPATNAADLAVLVVDPPLAGPALPVEVTALDETVVGSEVSSAGYGATAGGEAPAGVRQEGTMMIAALEGADHVRLEPGPAMSCRGDSGGPIVSAGSAIAVTAAGDPGCVEYGLGVRLDVHAETFLAPALAEAAAWPAPAPRIGLDGICAATCVADAECPVGTRCSPAYRRCVVGTAPPGDLPTPCAVESPCAAGTCVSVGAACRCLASCDPEPPPPPPDDGGGGGCAVGGGRPPMGTCWLALLFVAARRKRIGGVQLMNMSKK